MEFKYIHQPEYSLRFRGYHRANGKTFPVTGFDKECVFTMAGGETLVFDRCDCEIDQWTGLLDQNEKMVFTNDIVEVRNSSGRPVGMFIVRYNSLEGRHVLDGVTRGAHTSRLTVYQDIRVVGNTHEKHFNVKEYAHV